MAEWHTDIDRKTRAECRVCGGDNIALLDTNGDLSYSQCGH